VTPKTAAEATFKVHLELSLQNNRVKLNIRSQIAPTVTDKKALAKEVLATLNTVGQAVKEC